MFAVSLITTLSLVCLAVLTGFLRRRRSHLVFVLLGVVSLVFTILEAERLGRGYDLETAGTITPVHLAIAKLTTLSFLGPIVTGILTWRDGRRRRLHRKLVFLTLGLTVLALVTGTWMVLASDPL